MTRRTIVLAVLCLSALVSCSDAPPEAPYRVLSVDYAQQTMWGDHSVVAGPGNVLATIRLLGPPEGPGVREAHDWGKTVGMDARGTSHRVRRSNEVRSSSGSKGGWFESYEDHPIKVDLLFELPAGTTLSRIQFVDTLELTTASR